ncbi:MAG: glycerol-3-phosphate dehydrogenase [Pyrinomonadaceae bacterium]
MRPLPNISEITFDVIIIGAGINGAGIARDAAMRDLSVLLIDKGDIGGGTTSWSTRLIHGGLRYLEHGELGLVRESLREREALFHIAPHLVKPLPILIPIYSGRKRGPLTIRAGMITYDLLSFNKSLPRHRMLSRSEVLQQTPALNPEGLLGAAIYYDAQVEFAERLVVENVLSAREHGATIVTYAKVQKLISEDRAVRKVEAVDVLSGETFAAKGRIVVNASGPWVDQVLASTGKQPARLIGGTKGSHLVVGPFPGASSTALYVEAEADGRPLFIIPWDRKYLIGTTDTRFAGDLDKVEIEDNEIDYLLQETNRVVPAAALNRDSILYTYSGVRPLPYTESKDEQSITRRHFVRESREVKGLFSIIGGKLTTYRSLAEQTVDLILRKLGRNAAGSTTASASLPGAGATNLNTLSDRIKRSYGVSSMISERLPRVYGTRASDVVMLAREDKSLFEVFDAETGAIAAEVVYAFTQEMAQTIADCLLRRTMVGLNTSMGIGADEAAAKVAQKYLGWSEDKAQNEVENYRSYVERFQTVRLKL